MTRSRTAFVRAKHQHGSAYALALSLTPNRSSHQAELQRSSSVSSGCRAMCAPSFEHSRSRVGLAVGGGEASRRHAGLTHRERHEACHEPIERVFGLFSLKLLKAPPGNDAAPVSEISDVIDLDADLWVLAQHVELQPRGGMSDERPIGGHVRDGHDVRSSLDMATNNVPPFGRNAGCVNSYLLVVRAAIAAFTYSPR